jgi:hypothetical protein
MNNKFDELTRGLAKSVSRRQALRKFGAGLAGMVLACFVLLGKATASGCRGSGAPCKYHSECCSGVCDGLFSSRRGRCI